MPENGDLLLDFNFEPFDSYEFHCWCELPDVLKIKILQYLPYPTIRRFMLLSKECYMLASKAKIQAEVVLLREQSYRMEMGIPGEKNRMDLVVCWMPPDKQLLRGAHKKYRLSFAEDPNGGCYVEKRKIAGLALGSGREKDVCQLREGCTTMKTHCSLYPQIERVLKEEPSSTTLCSNTFEIHTEDRSLIPMLLRFLRPKCRFVIYSGLTSDKMFLQTPFFDSDVVRAARDLYIHVETRITDSQITKLQAPVLRINSPYISAWSVNKLILQWLEGKREIIFVQVRATRDLPRNEVFQGIDPAALITGTEASDGRDYDPSLYTLVRSNRDYHLFRSMSHSLSEQRFKSFEGVEKWVTEWIELKDEAFCGQGIRFLPERWEKVKASDGQYFD
ncbi:F-box domain protein [Ancylostoma duodenale]|uniref:F-box domain protein n=1 Tax=Ancylostoma duodenale TaxID=51022 RepID=A0A0C2GHB4_9BILA|nr:F-box domain protein [Ancylostoma duodenale]